MTTASQPDLPPLLRLAEGLRAAATQLGLPRLGAQLVEETSRRIADAKLRVLVLGEIKQGKSTLINALLGEVLLPTGVTPTTGAIVQIVRGDATERLLVGPDAREVLTPERFAQLARGKESAPGRLLITTTSPHLPPQLELVDTPGINDVQRFRSLISRGELPRGDAILLVLDATQALKRTELAFLRDILVAVGGLGDSGATLLLAVGRIDLVPESERPAVLGHIKAELAGLLPAAPEIFTTDAKTAVKSPVDPSPGVQEVARLRERLRELASASQTLSPVRARGYLLRSADLLGHHAATAARALRLERTALQAEIAEIQKSLIDRQIDFEELRATITKSQGELATRTREHLQGFRAELEQALLKQLERADLRVTAEILPGAAQDALMHFVYTEAERLRLSLEQLTREVLHTCGEQAQRRLAVAMLSLGMRGPVVQLRPPSVFVEAGTLAVGLAGTAVMYFGNIVAGLTMTIAAPLATMFLRERSIRELRANAVKNIPVALSSAFAGLESAFAAAIDDHAATLEEILVLAHAQLGDQLQSLLQRVLDLDPAPALTAGEATPGAPAPAPSESRKAAAAELRALEPRIAELRAELVALFPEPPR